MTMAETIPMRQCAALVEKWGGGAHLERCSRRARVDAGGAWMCAQHAALSRARPNQRYVEGEYP